MTIPICILPVVLWALQSQAIAHLSAPPVSKAILHYSAEWIPPVSHASHPQLGSSASPGAPLSTSHPGFCHWALLAAAGLHGKESQNWFTHCVFYVRYTVCVLMAGNQHWGVLVVTHRVGTAQALTHRHPEPPVHWYNHRTPLPLSSLCRHCQCFPPSSPTRQFSMHPEFGNITLAELGDFFPEQKDKWGDLEIPLL